MTINRRQALGLVAASATALSLNAKSYGRVVGSNARLRIGVIGINSRGKDHIKGFGEQVAAVCDCDAQVLEAVGGPLGVERYQDFRKLLDQPNIDAISIATPNHTHSLIAIMAMQANKHVYVEKPVSHNVWEGRQLASAAQQLARVCQCGTQSRSSPAILQAVEYVRSGKLGKIQYAIGTCYKPRLSIGLRTEPLPIPAHIDYPLWCGPADPKPIYRPKLHYDWHWDFNTGNGDMGNQGIHQMDIARWFLGEQELSPRVVSIGARLGYVDAGNTPNTQVVLHAYKNAPLIFETRGLPADKKFHADRKEWEGNMDRFRGSRVGVIVQCEHGHVMIPNYTSAEAFDASGTSIQKWEGGGDAMHYQNFVDAVIANDPTKLNAPVVQGHISSALCHTGGVSHQIGKPGTVAEVRQTAACHPVFADAVERMITHLAANGVDLESSPQLVIGADLKMDPATEQFTNSAAANELLKRTGKAPFEIPQLELISGSH